MPSKSRLFSQLIASSGQIKAEKLSDDISTIEQVSSTDNLSSVGNVIGDQRVVGNTLYIWNGSGWYRIALINETPTWDSGGQPSSSYELDADSPQDATIITLAASDPDGLPISYSYVTGGSMDSMATISQDSSVFTITPKTVAQVGGVELTGSVTFRASDGVNILPSVSSFTLNFITIIENSRYTTLLVTSTGTGDNNDITDASSSNHTITVNGNTHAGTFSPYRHSGYSTYFDGTGDYLRNGTTLTGPSAATFTIECWVYMTANPSNTQAYLSPMFADGSNFSSSIYLFAGPDNDRVLAMYWWDGAGQNVKGNTALNLNQWYHIAFVVNSNDIKIYVDGAEETLSGTTTYSTWPGTNNGFEIGANQFGAFTGYIRDLRVTNTAVYTSNFTAPEQSLTAISGTQLLACRLPYINDGSTNDYTLTVGGNTSTRPFTPFNNLEYSESDNGGSVYFDGNADYLTIPASDDFRQDQGDWTIDGWFYFKSFASAIVTLSLGSYQGIDNFTTYITTTGAVGYEAGTGTSWAALANYSSPNNLVSLNTWNHIAWVRSSGSLFIYLNGTRILNQASATFGVGTSGNLYIGNYFGQATLNVQPHYQSDLRIIKGTALYTGDSFSVPTAPLSSSGAELHIKGTEASIIDKSQSSNLQLIGNTTGSTTQVKFSGFKSMYFDGSSDYLTTSQQELGNEDFTIEGWHYLLTRANNRNGIFSNYSSYSAGSLGMFAGHGSGTSTAYQVAYNGAAFPGSVIQGGTIVYNQWVHFAVVRNSGTMSLYIDGTSVDSISATASLNGVGTNFTIGAPGDNLADGMQGYLQDFRITKGLARYTSNFTPPTAPLKG